MLECPRRFPAEWYISELFEVLFFPHPLGLASDAVFHGPLLFCLSYFDVGMCPRLSFECGKRRVALLARPGLSVKS